MNRLLDRVFRYFDHVSEHRRYSSSEEKKNSVYINILIAILLVFSVAPFFLSLQFISDWPPKEYEHPQVWSLTRADVQWDVLIGKSQMCGELECHLTGYLSSSNFDYKSSLPQRQFPLHNYRYGDYIYYRTKVSFPDSMKSLNEVVYFNSLYVWAKSYRVYFNEELVDSGGSQQISIPISRSQINSGELNISIFVDPTGETYQGLEHMGEIVIGPKSVLSGLTRVTHDADRVWPLWGMLPPLVLCFIFCLFFVANPRSVESAVFSLFLAGIVVYRYFVSSYSYDFRLKIVELTQSKISSIDMGYISSFVTSFLLLTFLVQYFRLLKKPSVIRSITSTLLVAFLATTVCYFDVMSDKRIFEVVTWTRFGVLLFAAVISSATWFYLKKRKIYSYRNKAILMFLSLTLLSIALYFTVVFKVSYLSLGTIGDRLYVSILMFSLSYLTTLEYAHYFSQKDWLNFQFKSFLGANLADELMKNPESMAPREVDVAVMFTDIRSFTSLSEKLEAQEIVQILNKYMEKMIAVINDHGGLIDKFAGDSIMASWGIPLMQENDVERAVRCAFAMRKALTEFNKEGKEQGWPELRVGMGIHYGRAVAGVIGSKDRKEYTLIGDTINTASRIEGQTKNWGCDILLSAEVADKIQKEALLIDCGEQGIRGKNSVVNLYQLVGMKSKAGTLQFHSSDLQETFADFREPQILSVPTKSQSA